MSRASEGCFIKFYLVDNPFFQNWQEKSYWNQVSIQIELKVNSIYF